MTVDRSAICAWLGDLGAVLVKDDDDLSDFRARISLAPDFVPQAFATEALQLMRIVGESVVSATDFDSLKSASFSDSETQDVAVVLLAVGLALAGGRAAWISRPQARAGRDRIAAVGDAALAVASGIGADAAEFYGWLVSLVQISIRLVSDIAADLAPIVRVETGISMPSTVLAYQLYGDAARAGSLVDVGGTSTSMLMPVAFDALES